MSNAKTKNNDLARCARLVGLVLASAVFVGASLVLDGPTQSGDVVAYPVSVVLDPAENAAGIQFDIDFDPAAVQVVDIQPGPAADYAGKTVEFSMYDEDTARVLVLGMNEAELGSGVVANVYVTPVEGSGGTTALRLTGVAFCDPAGNPVAPAGDSDQDSGADSGSDFEADSGSSATNKPADSSAADSAPAVRETASSEKSSAVSPGFMPALLDNFLGDYAPAGSGNGKGRGAGTDHGRDAGTDHGRDGYSGGHSSVDGVSGATPTAYGRGGRLAPQVYSHHSSRRPAPKAGSGVSRPHSVTKNGSESARTSMARAELARPSLSDRRPLHVNWPAPAVVALRGAEKLGSTPETVNTIEFSRYATRRSILPAAACAVALLLVLRNACAPLWRLVRDVARF